MQWEFKSDEFWDKFLGSFGLGIKDLWGDLATLFCTSLPSAGRTDLGAQFTSLSDHLDKECRRLFPPGIVDQFQHSLLAYWNIAELLVPQLPQLLLAQTQCEAWLYADAENEFYREHFVHPLAVLYVGDKLLGAGHLYEDGDDSSRKACFDKVRDATFAPANDAGPLARFWRGIQRKCPERRKLIDKHRDEIIWAAWYLAAACHDVAQPYNVLNRVEKALAGIRWSGIDLPRPHDLEDYLDGHLWWEYLRWAVRKSNVFRQRGSIPHESVAALMGHGATPSDAAWHVIRQHARCNHSTPGALWLAALGRENARQAENEETGFLLWIVYELAAAAVLTHDWVEETDIYAVDRHCDPQENPLGWVLQLCDLLECWARPYRLPPDPHSSALTLQSEFAYPFDGLEFELAREDNGKEGSERKEELRARLYRLFRPCPNVANSLCNSEHRTSCCPVTCTLGKSDRPLTPAVSKVAKKCFLHHFEKQVKPFLENAAAASGTHIGNCPITDVETCLFSLKNDAEYFYEGKCPPPP